MKSEREQLSLLESLYSEKRFSDALKIARDALQGFPNSFQIKLLYVRILKEVNELKDAGVILDELMQIFPDNITLLLEAGDIALIQNKFDKALDYYNKILFLDPFNNQAKTAVDQINAISKEGNTRAQPKADSLNYENRGLYSADTLPEFDARKLREIANQETQKEFPEPSPPPPPPPIPEIELEEEKPLMPPPIDLREEELAVADKMETEAEIDEGYGISMDQKEEEVPDIPEIPDVASSPSEVPEVSSEPPVVTESEIPVGINIELDDLDSEMSPSQPPSEIPFPSKTIPQQEIDEESEFSVPEEKIISTPLDEENIQQFESPDDNIDNIEVEPSTHFSIEEEILESPEFSEEDDFNSQVSEELEKTGDMIIETEMEESDEYIPQEIEEVSLLEKEQEYSEDQEDEHELTVMNLESPDFLEKQDLQEEILEPMEESKIETEMDGKIEEIAEIEDEIEDIEAFVEKIEPVSELVKETDGEDKKKVVQEAEFVTESAAELYVKQGLLDDALDIYDQLYNKQKEEKFLIKITKLKKAKLNQIKINKLYEFLNLVKQKGE